MDRDGLRSGEGIESNLALSSGWLSEEEWDKV